MRERLKIIRIKKNLTQAQFAEKLGMTTTSYNYLENGKTPIQDKHIKAICGIFNIDETWLRTGMGEPSAENDVTRHILDITSELNLSNQRYLFEIARLTLEKQFEEQAKIDGIE